MMGIYVLLIFCAVPPSPAGGNYLDLSGDLFYFARDNPTLDELLGDEWTIEMWFYVKEFPSRPQQRYPIMNISFLLIKPGSYVIYQHNSWDKRGGELFIDKFLDVVAFFPHEEVNGVRGAVLGVPYDLPEDFLKGGVFGIAAGRWYHLAFQQKGMMIALYIDGVKRASKKLDPKLFHRWKLADFPTPLYVGYLPSAERFKDLFLELRWCERVEGFKGAIDELRISNVARYGNAFAPPGRLRVDGHTMALWHFDEPLGSLRYEDSSGNGNTLFSSKLLPLSLRGEKPAMWGEIKRGHFEPPRR